MSPRFCHQCRHYQPCETGALFARCAITLDEQQPSYLATGDPQYARIFCTSARTIAYTCGPQGKLWSDNRPLPQPNTSAGYRAAVDQEREAFYTVLTGREPT